MMRRPLVLDLFSGPGCAALGFLAAGFDVLGVDTIEQDAYPSAFVAQDALTALAASTSLPLVAVFADPPVAYPQRDVLRAMMTRRGVPWVMGGTWADLDPRRTVTACGRRIPGAGDFHAHRAFEPGPGVALICEPCRERVGLPDRRRRLRGGEVRNGVRHPHGEAAALGWASLGPLDDRQLAEGVPAAFAEWIGHAFRRAVA